MRLAGFHFLFPRPYDPGLPQYLVGAQAIEPGTHLFCRCGQFLWAGSRHIFLANLTERHQHQGLVELAVQILRQRRSYLVDRLHKALFARTVNPWPGTASEP